MTGQLNFVQTCELKHPFVYVHYYIKLSENEHDYPVPFKTFIATIKWSDCGIRKILHINTGS